MREIFIRIIVLTGLADPPEVAGQLSASNYAMISLPDEKNRKLFKQASKQASKPASQAMPQALEEEE